MRLCLDVRFARTKFREIAYRFHTGRLPANAHSRGQNGPGCARECKAALCIRQAYSP